MPFQVAAAGDLVGLASGEVSALWSWEPALDAGAVLQRVVREQREALTAIKKVAAARLVAFRRHTP